VEPDLLAGARASLEGDRVPRVEKCSVCAAAASGNPAEKLCWVCRHLKISAWKDADLQQGQQQE